MFTNFQTNFIYENVQNVKDKNSKKHLLDHGITTESLLAHIHLFISLLTCLDIGSLAYHSVPIFNDVSREK